MAARKGCLQTCKLFLHVACMAINCVLRIWVPKLWSATQLPSSPLHHYLRLQTRRLLGEWPRPAPTTRDLRGTQQATHAAGQRAQPAGQLMWVQKHASTQGKCKWRYVVADAVKSRRSHAVCTLWRDSLPSVSLSVSQHVKQIHGHVHTSLA